MGGQVSAHCKLDENELLRKFCGLEPITDNDPFWNRLLSFNLRVDERDRAAARQLEESAADLFEALMYNTATTGNLAAFVRVFLRRANELKTSAQCEDKIFTWQTANALVILRFCCKFLTQRLSEAELSKAFEKKAVITADGQMEACSSLMEDDSFDSTSEEFLHALVENLVDLPVNDLTMSVHVETVRCLVALLSVQLYAEKPLSSSLFLCQLVSARCSRWAFRLTRALLTNFLEHADKTGAYVQSGGSVVLGVASSVWSLIQWGTGLSDAPAEDDYATTPDGNLGDVSLLLLLVLSCHQPPMPAAAAAAAENDEPNVYRQALSSFLNTQEISPLTDPSVAAETFKLDYGALYERFCTRAGHEPTMLLLYLLLHRNCGFRNYVLSRVNLENLVLPVLRVLSQRNRDGGAQSNSHHVYLALIVLLILSEDDFFCKLVHESAVRNVDWFPSEHPISEISLGGLIVLVLIRNIQHNIVRLRDRYLHTNCLAALANMSSRFKHLPASVCQKLVGLLEVLTKRHARLVDSIRVSAELDLCGAQGNNAAYQQDITALEEGVRTLLEILNSCLSNNLRDNPHLVYTMLYKRELFDAFHQHPMFQDLIWNITMVLNHFTGRVQALSKGATVAQVLDVIQKGALQWPTDRLKKFPELKFKYVEDEHTEEFFVPYVWKLIYKHSALCYDPVHIRLFNAQTVL